MIRAIKAGLALPARDKWIALQSVVLLPLVAFWLRLRGFNAVHRVASRRLGRASGADLGEARRIAAIVNAVANRGPYRANCLKRTLVAWWLIGRRGTGTTIRFGVRPGRPPAFHSWLEIDGAIVNDSPNVATQYLPFAKPIERDSLGRFD